MYNNNSKCLYFAGTDADLLIHEATLEDELMIEALEKKHRFGNDDWSWNNEIIEGLLNFKLMRKL